MFSHSRVTVASAGRVGGEARTVGRVKPSPRSGTTLREYHFDPTLNERWTELGKSTQTEFN